MERREGEGLGQRSVLFTHPRNFAQDAELEWAIVSGLGRQPNHLSMPKMLRLELTNDLENFCVANILKLIMALVLSYIVSVEWHGDASLAASHLGNFVAISCATSFETWS
ncbi:hypothetical protein V6N12_067209 [Hibiscus sabdariffa]|uniref:Uncharacterized protein n=1 Tax=Hibiscus sabdariffa TaxID=183260 RepID=A0ABR2BDM6_9ROSI